MRRQCIAILFGILAFGWACSDDEEQLPVIEPEAQGIEKIGDKEFSWVRYGNLEWMTKNLDIQLEEWMEEGCEVSREDTRNPIDRELEIEQNYATFGCLYSYEAAEAALSEVPEGWRIPTDEDWKALEKAMGMADNELDATDWRGTFEGILLQQEDGTKVNLRAGGMGEYNSRGYFFPYFSYVYGFYWTSTPVEEGSNSYYCRQISYNSGRIARMTVDKSKMVSVRLVRDVK